MQKNFEERADKNEALRQESYKEIRQQADAMGERNAA
jgi:hypothetical protein